MEQLQRGSRPRLRRLAAVTAVILAGGIALSACGGGSSSAPKKTGGIINFAEGAGANPNYIFPYMGCSYFSVSNINQFQQLMYRPLYWFGLGSSTEVQYPLSTANQPTFSNNNHTVKFTMKNWKFSDGTTVGTQSVMFFLNLYKADPTSYCGYNKGYAIPDQLAAVTTSGSTVTLQFKVPVNPNWLLYNYLSQITPMPAAWDKTSSSAAPGSGGCATGVFGASSTDSKCIAVEKFLDSTAAKLNTFTNSMWQTVDGPWKLVQMDQVGDAQLVPNTSYSGPQKPYVSKVVLKAYTASSAVQSDLEAGALQIGYVDPTALPGPAPSPGAVGPNISSLAGSYTLQSGAPWSFNYAPYNFAKSDPMGVVLQQLYVRQALQMAIDQDQIITSINKGYGFPTCSPLPPTTPSSLSPTVSCKYKYNTAGAKALFIAHGWKLVSNVFQCENPGTGVTQCGSGVKKGTQMHLSLIYASGSPSLDQTFQTEVSEWQSIGVKVQTSTANFNTVVSQCSGGSFQICSWGAGWIYAPDYYPSGETLFTPQGSFNPGQYNNPVMTGLIKQTTAGNTNLYNYATFAASDLPVLYQPNPAGTIEISNKLHGVMPPNPLQNFMPEYMYF